MSEHVWGGDGEGSLGVYLQPAGSGLYGLGLIQRRRPNRKERRAGSPDPVLVMGRGAGLTVGDLTRLRARIDEVLQEETHDGQQAA